MKKNCRFELILGVSFALSANTGFAILVPVGPFSGDLSETWESFSGYVQPSGPSSIMGGAATFTTQAWAISTVGGIRLSMYDSGISVPSDGIKSAGAINNPSVGTIAFSSPVYSFGGYWGVPTGGLFRDLPVIFHWVG